MGLWVLPWHEHERVGAALLLRRQHFDIDLALHDLRARFADVMAADIKEAALCDRRLIDRRVRKLQLGKRRRAKEPTPAWRRPSTNQSADLP